MSCQKDFKRLSTADTKIKDLAGRTAEIFLWILGLTGGIFLIGFHVTLPLFTLLYTKTYGAGWKNAVSLALLPAGFLVLIFDQLIHVIWPTPVLIGLLR